MFASLTTHRHLLMTMVRREVGARFVGSSLGGLWSLIQPAIMLGLYTMVFSVIYRIRDIEGGHGFPEFVFCGLWPWMAFQEACIGSVTAITSNANLVKKLQFPSELLVISAVMSSFVVHGVGFVLFLIGLMVWKGTLLGMAGVFLIVPISLHLVFAVGIGMLLACGNVFFRDVGQLTGAAFTMWFFLTPILYPASLVPEAVRTFQVFNPMIPIINAYRSIILTGIFAPDITLAYSLGLAAVLLWLGNYVFQRCRGFFADYL